MADCRKRQARAQAEAQAAAEQAEAETLAAAELARTKAEAKARQDAEAERDRQIQIEQYRAAQQAKQAMQDEIESRPISGVWDGKQFKPSIAQMKYQFTLHFPLTNDRRALYPVTEQVDGKWKFKVQKRLFGKLLYEFVDESGTVYRMTKDDVRLAKTPEAVGHVIRVSAKTSGNKRWVNQYAQATRA